MITERTKTKYSVWVTSPGATSKTYLARMETFVSSYHPFAWPEARLAESWVLDLETDGEVVGYTWFYHEINNVWSVHMAVHPDHRRRWASRRVLDELFRVIDLSGMQSCIAYCPTPTIARIWQRLGFTYVEHAYLAYLDTSKDNKNGLPETQSTKNIGSGPRP